MKRILSAGTFWSFVAGLIIVLNHYTGGDVYAIGLIEWNPLLRLVLLFPQIRRFMYSGLQIAFDGMGPNPTVSIYWYIGCVISFLLYGFVIDWIRAERKRSARHS
jgi:hypothetical protein